MPPTTPDCALLDWPDNVKKSLLPIPDASVLDFIKFPLPVVTRSNCDKFSPSDFFSRQPVNYNTPGDIQKIPIPPAKTVDALRSALNAMIRTGQTSVVYAHITSKTPRYFPLWVILYWSEVIVLRIIRDTWSGADENLGTLTKVWEKPKGQHIDQRLIQRVYDTLSVLPWSGNIHGFSNSEPLHSVTTYASPKCWFSEVHEHQMLDLLHRDIRLHTRGAGIEVENLSFFEKMKQAYDGKERGQYEVSREFTRLRGVGLALARRERKVVGFLTNINKNHWVAIVLDFERLEFLYGDPLGWAPSKELVDVIDWWTTHHAGLPFVQKKLLTTDQPDGHNCGMLANNALCHHFLPEKHPLMKMDRLDEERLQILLKVLEHHGDRVSLPILTTITRSRSMFWVNRASTLRRKAISSPSRPHSKTTSRTVTAMHRLSCQEAAWRSSMTPDLPNQAPRCRIGCMTRLARRLSCCKMMAGPLAALRV